MTTIRQPPVISIPGIQHTALPADVPLRVNRVLDHFELASSAGWQRFLSGESRPSTIIQQSFDNSTNHNWKNAAAQLMNTNASHNLTAMLIADESDLEQKEDLNLLLRTLSEDTVHLDMVL